MLPLPGLPSGRDAAATPATLSVHPPGSVSGPVNPLLTLPVNPTEYAVSKAVTFAEIGVPGLDAPPLQFVRGGARTLKLDALVDAAEEPVRGRRDVQRRWLNDFQSLTTRQSTTHAPPVVTFAWGANPSFTGVVDSLSITYVLFDRDGTPTRAKVSLSLKEFRTAEEQNLTTATSSPTVQKVWTVRRGDTLSSIAAAVYRDSGRWRELAAANSLADPRALAPGMALVVPALDRG
ncbi:MULTISPECIES: LysM peptidoglycan-binding domain-containing protein [unclassified Streptomyces]|uniref:CIS tube protein n=1 Tax=unclassified Streptomyces TaxID=2593676 RepID=UPI002DD89687|nr:LysM peptidoglycan-binding domain-containing protein [Streptomyces sp. NBC_01750]WSA98154.1 LysM peptidoglycan-binding domain-containing protein [Streptomyces sp. NBC_01794]WSD37309.1 LysM peptidoglycan-binding domain-containing protein [Streptomyces sp. NBC_01750]